MLNINESYHPSIVSLSSDGSELFPHLWRYFLRHQHIRDWLMRRPPYLSSEVNPINVTQGVAFCCNFSTPELWSDMASSFDMGEMFIPDHQFRNFMCGTIIAASPFHKHLICALGSAATRHSSILASFKTNMRRMVVDMRSANAINLIEFSWMEDGMLIVTAKVLVPPSPGFQRTIAGCSGAFALFNNVTPGGMLPAAPISFVSFVEAPLCPSCSSQGSLGCFCPAASVVQNQYSSAVWPQATTDDMYDPACTTLQNVKQRLASIHRISHVKVTAHVVTPEIQQRDTGCPVRTYKLGSSRYIIKAVEFRPSTPLESDTLRQVADKWRLLRAGSLPLLSLQSGEQNEAWPNDDVPPSQSKPKSPLCVKSTHLPPGNSANTRPSAAIFEGLMRSNLNQNLNAMSGVSAQSNVCESCGSRNEFLQDGGDLMVCSCMLSTDGQTASSCESFEASDAGDDKLGSKPKAANRPTCHLCGKEFSQQGSLNRHMRNIHEEKKIPCQYCPMSFGQMFDLRRHQKRKHPDRRIAIKKCERIETKVLSRPVARLKN